MPQRFKSRLTNGEKLIGTMITLPCASTAEILADVGFDWLFVDGEHGPLGTAEILSILQAVGDRIACIVRVPSDTEARIKQTLDMGATGIIVPQVNSAAQAENVVRYARYAPEGARGVGLGRASGYGMQFGDYMPAANDQTVVIVQAEHIESVDNIDSILKVPGIDAIQLGPYDLSASMGKMGQIDDAEVKQSIERVIVACQAANIPIGYFGVNPAAVQPYADRGCSLITVGVDTLFLGLAAKEQLAALRDGA